MPVDIELARRNIEVFKHLEAQVNEQVARVTKGEVQSATQVAKLREFINANFPDRKTRVKYHAVTGEPLKNLQAGTIDALLAKDDLHPDLRTLLEARKVASKASVKKYQSMLDTHVNGRVYDTSRYHTAHTGRHGGTRLQTQNFFRPSWKHEVLTQDMIPSIMSISEIKKLRVENNLAFVDRYLNPKNINQLIAFFNERYGSTAKVLSSMLRASIKAPEGKEFICADYVGVETCVIMWLADEPEALDMLRRGESLYKWMAGMIYDKPASDIQKGTTEYLLGKIAILALVYGMGQQKDNPTFTNTCENWGVKNVSFDQGMHIVYGVFREQFPNIVQYWSDIEDAFTESLTQCVNVRFNNLVFEYDGGEFLFIRLPSGRRIAYNKPEMRKVKRTRKVERMVRDYKDGPYRKVLQTETYWTWTITYMGHHTLTRKWVRLQTWGGKITENVDQAIASCLLRRGMINAEQAGYPIIMSVHDEILCEVPTGFGSVREFEN
ncbi:MAG: DNA polymerase family A protein, partial [Planctomycetota bacterium]